MGIQKNKSVKMLDILDSKIVNCERCSLHSGGHCKPFWTENSQFGIIGEAPGKNEVLEGSPFVGAAGRYLWEIFQEFGYSREHFLIINSANCRPTDGRKNLKPNDEQLQTCRKWIELYMRVIRPSRVLLLGNYATSTILGEKSGILSTYASVEYNNEFKCHVIRSVHPSMCIYRGDSGKQMLREAIKVFSLWI